MRYICILIFVLCSNSLVAETVLTKAGGDYSHATLNVKCWQGGELIVNESDIIAKSYQRKMQGEVLVISFKQQNRDTITDIIISKELICLVKGES